MKDEDQKVEFNLSEWIACKSIKGGFTGWFVLGLFGIIMFIIGLFLTVGPFVLALALEKWWLILLWIVTFPIAIGLFGWINDDLDLW